jgi:glycosyltransferase involved in cell wall biosynthesis
MNPLISYLITTHNEGQCLEWLLNRVCSEPSDLSKEVIVVDDYSSDPLTLEILDRREKNGDIKVFKHALDNHYGNHKNYGNSMCSGKYIFQIDGDELPHEILLMNLQSILESNPSCEMFWVPRVNNFIGITPEDIKNYGWRVNEKGYVVWPDYQSRIYLNAPHIKWERKLHETIVGFKQYAKLPEVEELALFHTKTIEKQRSDNNRYMNNFSTEDNIRR